jgi:hypothetical protein
LSVPVFVTRILTAVQIREYAAMRRIRMEDVTLDREVTREDMKRVHGGAYTAVCMLPR